MVYQAHSHGADGRYERLGLRASEAPWFPSVKPNSLRATTALLPVVMLTIMYSPGQDLPSSSTRALAISKLAAAALQIGVPSASTENTSNGGIMAVPSGREGRAFTLYHRC